MIPNINHFTIKISCGAKHNEEDSQNHSDEKEEN
jgi:hypothetical protein